MRVWAAILLAGCSGISPGDQRVLAQVGDEAITQQALTRELSRLETGVDMDDAAPPPSMTQKRAMLDNLINMYLLLQEAKRVHVFVSMDEVESAYSAARSGWPDKEFYEELRAKDLTPAELKGEIHEQLTVRRYIQQHLFARVVVTDSEIERYLADHADLHAHPERVRAQQIVMTDAERASGVREKIGAELTFEEAALRYSVSPEGKSGGDLGYFARGAMPKAIEDICFSLEPGQVSAVVATDYGYHIFRVLDHQPAGETPDATARSMAERFLRQDKERAAQEQHVVALRRATRVHIYESALAKVP